MAQPLVIAYHLVWTAYGWWLPNDPRGSGSRLVRNPQLRELGTLHHGRKANQPSGSAIRKFYNHARLLLQHELLELSFEEIQTAACGIAEAITEHRYTCYAAAIMPDHVHLVIRKHKHTAEEMIENLQALSRERLVEEGRREHNHPVWTHGGWKTFLDRPSGVRCAIRYVERNPKQVQRWPFVTTYNDWPLHPGHNPNSPYARRLRAAQA